MPSLLKLLLALLNSNKNLANFTERINKNNEKTSKMKGLLLVFAFLILALVSFAQNNQCDYKVEVLVDREEFNQTNFTWKMKATKLDGIATNITGTAEIEDSSSHVVKSYKPWISEAIYKQKTSSEYSPNLKDGNYKIKAEIYVVCDDTDKENNVEVKSIKIKSDSKTGASKQQSENNNQLPQPKTKINDSEINKFAINETKEENNQQSIIQMTSSKETASQEPENVIQLKNSSKENQKLQAAIVQEPKIVYESSNEKVKSLILIFLLILSILFNIVLIWKR